MPWKLGGHCDGIPGVHYHAALLVVDGSVPVKFFVQVERTVAHRILMVDQLIFLNFARYTYVRVSIFSSIYLLNLWRGAPYVFFENHMFELHLSVCVENFVQELKAAQHPCSEMLCFTLSVKQMSSYRRNIALSALRRTVETRSVAATQVLNSESYLCAGMQPL